VDESLYSDAHGGFQQALRRRDVAAFVQIELRPASRQTGIGRQMEHDIDAGQQPLDRLRSKIELMKSKRGVEPGAEEVRFLDGAWIVRQEGIDADDIMTVAQHALTQVRADEPSSPGDQAFH